MPNQHTDGPGPVAIQHRDYIIAQLSIGKRLSDIAPTLDVSIHAISKVLKDDPDYHAAMQSSFEVRIDSAENAILDAAEQVDVSRARAYHDAIKWRAGVECTKWQARTQITVDIHHHLGESLQRAESREREINPPIERIAQSDARIIDADTVRTPSVDQ